MVWMRSWKSRKDLFSFLLKTIFQLSCCSFQGNWLWNCHHYWCVRFLQSRFLLLQAASSLSWLLSELINNITPKLIKSIINNLLDMLSPIYNILINCLQLCCTHDAMPGACMQGGAYVHTPYTVLLWQTSNDREKQTLIFFFDYLDQMIIYPTS